MTVKKLILGCVAGLTFINISIVYAQGIPVYDNSQFLQSVQQTANMLKQIEQMAKDYQKQVEQLEESVRQTTALTGGRGMGSFMNGEQEAQLRRYLPQDWQDALNGAGNIAGIVQQLESELDVMPGAEFVSTDPNGVIAQNYDRRNQTAITAMAASQQAYNTMQQRIGGYEAMLSELDNTQDLKASVDLLARISIENGLILSELMRMNAIQMQVQASRDVQEITSARRAARANSYDPAAVQAFLSQGTR